MAEQRPLYIDTAAGIVAQIPVGDTIFPAVLGTGTRDGTKFLRDDGAWIAVGVLSDGDKGDITVSAVGTVWTIDAGVVTYAKMQSASAGFTIMAKATTAAGVYAELAAGADTVLRRSGSGDLAFGTLVTNNFGASQITYAKIQNVSASPRVLGRTTAGAGVIEEITTTGTGSVAFSISPTFTGTLTAATIAATGLSVTNTGTLIVSADSTDTTGRSIIRAIATDGADVYTGIFAHGTTYSETRWGLAMAGTAVLDLNPKATGGIIGTTTNFPLIFGVNNAEVGRWSATGLGIGITPATLLHAYANTNASVASRLENASATAAATTGFELKTGANITQFYARSASHSTPEWGLYTDLTASPFVLWNNGGVAMTVSATRLFGFGGTPITGYMLEPVGRYPFYARTSDYVGASTGSALGIDFTAATGNVNASIQVTNSGYTAAGQLILQPNSGNVGVGVTPQTGIKLHVLGPGVFHAGAAAYPTSGAGIEIVPEVLAGVDSILAYNRTASTWRELRLYGDKLTFWTQGVERMRVTALGDVGIGNTPINYANYINLGLGSATKGANIDFMHNGAYEGYMCTAADALYVCAMVKDLNLQADVGDIAIYAIGATKSVILGAGNLNRLYVQKQGTTNISNTALQFTPASTTTWYRIGSFPTPNIATSQSVELYIFATRNIGSSNHHFKLRISKSTTGNTVPGVTAVFEHLGSFTTTALGIAEVRIYDLGANAATHVDVRFASTDAYTLSVQAQNSVANGAIANIFVVDTAFTSQGTTANGSPLDALTYHRAEYDSSYGWKRRQSYSGSEYMANGQSLQWANAAGGYSPVLQIWTDNQLYLDSYFGQINIRPGSTGAVTLVGTFTTTGFTLTTAHLALSGVSSAVAGSIFSNAAWGMGYVARIAGSNAQHAWFNESIAELMRLNGTELRVAGTQGVWASKFVDATNVSGTVVSASAVDMYVNSVLMGKWNATGLGVLVTPGVSLHVGPGTGQQIVKVDGASSGNALGAQFMVANASTPIIGIGNFSSIYGGAYSNVATIYGATTINLHPGGLNAIGLTVTTTGFGYAAGVGGTVTQATSKSTAVTLDKVCGEITMHNANLATDATVQFTCNNNKAASTDNVFVNVVSGGTATAYNIHVAPGSGVLVFNVRNVSGGDLAEAIVIRFTIVKAATT